MFAPTPPAPDAELSLAPTPAAGSPEALRRAGELEATLGQARRLEDRLRLATAEARRSRTLRAHWWTRLGQRLGLLPAEDGGAAGAEAPGPEEDGAAERLTFMEPSALGVLRLQVRRLQAEAREREERHAREAAAWRQKTADLAARAWLESYRRDVRRRLWADWPGWLWWRAQRFGRTRWRVLRRRLSRRAHRR